MLGHNCMYVCRGLPGLAKSIVLGMSLRRSLPTHQSVEFIITVGGDTGH